MISPSDDARVTSVTRFEATVLSLALGGVLALTAHAHVLLVAATVVVVQLLVATAPAPADARGRTVSAPRFWAAALAGLVATVLTVRPSLVVGAEGTTAGRVGHIESGTLAAVLPAVAVGVVAALVSQMFRRDGRRDLVSSTGYAVALAMFAALSVGWISTAQGVGGDDAVTIAVVAIGAGLLVWTIPLDRWVCGGAAILAGGAAGAGAALLIDTYLTWFFGVVVGTGVALFAVLGQVLGRAWTQGRRHATASSWGFPAALSLALAAPVVHVGGQIAGSF